MDFEFDNKDLENLYVNGKSKKYRLQHNDIENFFKLVKIIGSADTIHDFWKLRSLNFERLKGTKSGFSIRGNSKYRLEFEILFENVKKTKGRIIILEYSNHYD